MKKSNIAAIALLTTLFAATAGNASAFGLSHTSADFGAPAAAKAASHTIVIQADTKYVRVENGDTVQFDVNGKTFAFAFNTLTGETSFELSRIAPQGVEVPQVRVFVAPNPLYQG
jgi:hypothetical protein